MSELSPGLVARGTERWGDFTQLLGRGARDTLWLADAAVLAAHPPVARALKRQQVFALPGHEAVKSLRTLEHVLAAASSLPRSGWLSVLGGGSLGDLGTVAAHLLKRGVRLRQVPTTLLAAVDSSLGGKGAVDVRVGRTVVKNAAGVFHPAAETWLCPGFFDTLSVPQLRDGRMEAWKMFLCLDAGAWARFQKSPPDVASLVRAARRLKAQVCAQDPFDVRGEREVLNFGHTMGHVLESLTRFSLSHGEAVGLGMRCALDVGRAVGATSDAVAVEAEAGLERSVGLLPRARLAVALGRASDDAVLELVARDKKSSGVAYARFVLLGRVGRACTVPVRWRVLRSLLRSWRTGVRP